MAEQRKPGSPAPPPGRRNLVTEFDDRPPSFQGGSTVADGGFARSPSTAGGRFGSSPTTSGGSYQDRAPRARVSVPVRYRYKSIIDFVETQSVNVSKSGMFVGSDSPLPVGTLVQFEFSLADGFVILRGTAEVVRIINASGSQPRGMGLKFSELEEKSRKLIERIVEVNSEEGKDPTVPLADILESSAAAEFAQGGATVASPSGPPSGARPYPPGFSSPPTMGGRSTSGSMPTVGAAPSATAAASAVRWGKGQLQVVLNPTTAGFFVYNPLLNIKMGGFMIPADQDVPLGTMFDVQILDPSGKPMLVCKGKVVAKQDRRLGLRMLEADKSALAKLADDVNKLAPSK